MAEASADGRQTVQTALELATKRLRQARLNQPGLDVRLLLGHVLGVDQAQLIIAGNDVLAEKSEIAFCQAVERRLKGEPVSRIIGNREFYGREFSLSPAVLDPRADTETLVEAALSWAKHWTKQRAPSQSLQPAGRSSVDLRILDLGTGSGAIILTLLAELPEAVGVGVDVSADALMIAAENADKLGLTNRVTWICSDWDAALDERFDLIVSNPPYIAASEIGSLARDVRNFDPRLALDGGADGLDAYRALALLAERRLQLGGGLIVEIGETQAGAVREIFANVGLACEATKLDMAGRDRVIVAHRQ